MPIDFSQTRGNDINAIPALLAEAVARCTPTIINALTQQGIAVIIDAIPEQVRQALLDDFRNVTLTPAGIGRAQALLHDTSVRSDSIAWMDGATPVQLAWLNAMEQLRGAINRELFLGLFDYECHYAHYQQDQFYRRHRDAFADKRAAHARVLSTICYVNDSWQQADAGELVVFNSDNTLFQQIAPQPGTLVIFLSEQFPHEVLPTRADRYSIAGWFRRS